MILLPAGGSTHISVQAEGQFIENQPQRILLVNLPPYISVEKNLITRDDEEYITGYNPYEGIVLRLRIYNISPISPPKDPISFFNPNRVTFKEGDFFCNGLVLPDDQT